MLNESYVFICTEEISKERLDMGWGQEKAPQFVVNYRDCPEKCNEIINTYDAVIFGSAPYNLLANRVKNGKLTILYSERVFKKKVGLVRLFKYKISHFLKFGRYKNMFLLCSSAFAYDDYTRMMSFKNKAYKWGYFPKTHFFNPEEVIKNKKKKCISLLSVARMIDWKHPELVLKVAKKLDEEGIDFKLNMIGNGVLKNNILDFIEKNDLNGRINVVDHLSPEEVREYMIDSDIFLFTSDRNEGWGAVLNESMNSCCAVVASSAIGAVPFLLKNNYNGFIFEDGNFDDLYNKTKILCLEEQKRKYLGLNAFETISKEWSAEIASQRLIELLQDLLEKGNSSRFIDGPCSKAKIIKDDWFKNNK